MNNEILDHSNIGLVRYSDCHCSTKILNSLVFPCLQVAAQTGHKVTLVDISQDVLDKSAGRIGESIKRVAKKQHKDDQVR